MNLNWLFNFLQLTGGIILTIGYLPQLSKILKTKNVESFSLWSLSLVAFGIFLMELYAIHLVYTTSEGLSFLITNTLSFLCAISIVILVLKYKK